MPVSFVFPSVSALAFAVVLVASARVIPALAVVGAGVATKLTISAAKRVAVGVAFAIRLAEVFIAVSYVWSIWRAWPLIATADRTIRAAIAVIAR